MASRYWRPEYVISRDVSRVVKGDNVGAFTLLPKMRPEPHLAIIAREMALCVATSAFPPRMVHTPGVAHKVADMFSIVAQQESIQKVTETHDDVSVARRNASFYLILHG